MKSKQEKYVDVNRKSTKTKRKNSQELTDTDQIQCDNPNDNFAGVL